MSKNRKEGIFLSIVFSFYNEEQVLIELISRVRNAIKDNKFAVKNIN